MTFDVRGAGAASVPLDGIVRRQISEERVTITIDQQIKCLRQEVERRRRVFPLLVEQGKYTEEKATSEIETMRQAMQTLTQLRGLVRIDA